MNEIISRRNALLAETVIKGLKSRNMSGYYAETREEALRLASPRTGVNTVTPELSSAESILMAQRAMAKDNPEGALRSLVRCEKRDGEWYYMQGKVLMAMEEYDSAHQSFREAVRLDPDNNVFRAGALAAAVAQQKVQKLPGKVKKVFKHLVRR